MRLVESSKACRADEYTGPQNRDTCIRANDPTPQSFQSILRSNDQVCRVDFKGDGRGTEAYVRKCLANPLSNLLSLGLRELVYLRDNCRRWA